jgi:PAS domain S-box-containing protein
VKVKTQLIAIMVLITLLVMIPLIIFLNYQIKTMILNNEEANSYETLDNINLFTQNYINTVLTRMENIAKEPETIEASVSRDDSLLEQLSEKFSTIVDTSVIIENIGFQDENCIGIVADKKAMAAIKNYKGYDFSSRVYCKPTISAQKVYISSAYISLASKQPVLSVTAPIFSEEKMEGFIIGLVNIADLHNSLSGLKKENYLILIDKENNAFLDTRKSVKEIKIDKNSSEVSAINEKLKTSGQGTFEFEENIISFKKYKDYSIILIKPKESVLSIQESVFNTMLYSLIFIILLIIIASFLFSKIITKPIEVLTKKVNEVTTGNLNIELEKGETQEIQKLTESLNRILASMKLAILRTGVSKGELGLQEVVEAKEEAENKFKTLYETSSDAIMTLEPPSWKFTSGNPATIKMFNCKDEKQFISLGPWDISPEKQPDGQLSSDKAKKMIEKAMKEGKNYFEWAHKRYKGEEFSATVLLTKVGEGEKAYLQATVRDLTKKPEKFGIEKQKGSKRK